MLARKTALLGCLLIAILAAGVPAEAQGRGPIYIVQPGDTLYDIAGRFGVSITELQAANAIANPNALLVGMELVIPGFEDLSGELGTHALAYGEDLASVSRRFAISEQALIRLNRILNPARLYVGQPIIVPINQGGAPPPRVALELLAAGETRLEHAARAGISPWQLRMANLEATPGWLIGGDLLLGPENSGTPGALPLPILGMSFEPIPVAQGFPAEIRLTMSEELTLGGAFGEWPLRFFTEQPGEYVGLQGVHAMIEPGLYDLEIRLYADAGDLLFGYQQPIRIRSGGYGFDPVLYVPAETIDPENTAPEEQAIAAVVMSATAERYWEGPFAWPAAYTKEFPSRFGSRRNFNNTGYTTYHSGLDFYGSTGDAIFAPADGVVVFSRAMSVRGKLTIIDHGWGVYSGYSHQSQVLVNEGDRVTKGQVIGKVGATGRVTGAHLHWDIYVGGVPVDPQVWMARTYP